MDYQESSYRPYQKRVFFTLITTNLIALITLNIVLYLALTYSEFKDTQEALKSIAIEVSQKIPIDTHEDLTEPSQQSSSDYKQIESYFQSVMAGNPKIDDIYTLRPTGDPNWMVFVASGRATEDLNDNGEIEEDEEKANLGEEYDVSELPDMRAGLVKPSVDREITYDKWGSWLSGYAPIVDSNGNSVGLVGIDYQASIISNQRAEVRNNLLILDSVLIPIMFIMAYFLSNRLTRPFEILSNGLEQIAKKNFKYRPPFRSKGDDRIFEDLFGKIRATFSSHKSYSKTQSEPEHDKDVEKLL